MILSVGLAAAVGSALALLSPILGGIRGLHDGDY